MDTAAAQNVEITNSNNPVNEDLPAPDKYLSVMPVRPPESDDPEINIQNIKAYNNSLGILLSKYCHKHQSTKK